MSSYEIVLVICGLALGVAMGMLIGFNRAMNMFENVTTVIISSLIDESEDSDAGA